MTDTVVTIDDTDNTKNSKNTTEQPNSSQMSQDSQNSPNSGSAETTAVQTEATNQNASAETFETVLEEAKKLRFHNPRLAAKIAMAEESPFDELNRLAGAEKYMVGVVVSPTNPSVERTIPGTVTRIRRALQSKRLRLYK